MSLSENPSYYPPEHYVKRDKQREPIVVWVKLPMSATDLAALFRGLSKAWPDAVIMDSTHADGDYHQLVLR